MFHLFGKKEKSTSVKDVIWLNKQAKNYACSEQLLSNSNTVFVAWFYDTANELDEFLQSTVHAANKVIMAKELNTALLRDASIIFVEHYPLKEKEEVLFTKLQLKEAIVYSALDDAIFLRFGGENIQQLMIKMGMGESEPVEHALITASIKRAQQKISKKVTIEQSALSQSEWLKVNLKE
ncbi:MAG TPA: hypothetical protein PL045_00475 [Chitinophagaceae bacterium]|nr:hypothetical protein [Chitinophagaceae bacterium]